MDSIRLASILLLASKIELLSIDLSSWKSSNRLSFNSAKTQLIWFGTPQQLLKLDHALLSDRFPHFTFHTTVRDLGVTLDSALTFSQHISHLTRSSYFQLRRLRTIRKAVSVPIFTSIQCSKWTRTHRNGVPVREMDRCNRSVSSKYVRTHQNAVRVRHFSIIITFSTMKSVAD